MDRIDYSGFATAVAYEEYALLPFKRLIATLDKVIKEVVEEWTWDPAKCSILILREGPSIKSHEEAKAIYDRSDFPLERRSASVDTTLDKPPILDMSEISSPLSGAGRAHGPV